MKEEDRQKADSEDEADDESTPNPSSAAAIFETRSNYKITYTIVLQSCYVISSTCIRFHTNANYL